MKKLNRKQKTTVINVVVIALILCGMAWVGSLFIHIGSLEFTDNAQIRQDIVPVDSRVQGFVKDVRFEDFQHVSKGDTLMLIENVDYQLYVAQAEANYQNAIAGKSAMGATIETTSNNISVSDAGLEEVRIRLSNAEKEYNRYKQLLANESVTRQQFENIETQYNALKANYEMLQRQQNTTRLVKSEQKQRFDQSLAGIKVAEAALKLARLNLSYTAVLAPCDGFTSRKNIYTGTLIRPGQNIVSIVSDDSRWVVANFRERQMKNIKIGSMVKITVDAVPDIVFKGEVSAISNATGSQYSIVPQDNATGNFVKVEQRIPVKITFTSENNNDDLLKLGSGMNVECKIVQ